MNTERMSGHTTRRKGASRVPDVTSGNPADGLLTFDQAAQRLSCSRAHIYNLVTAGRLRLIDIGLGTERSKPRIAAEDIAAFIASSERPTRPVAKTAV